MPTYGAIVAVKRLLSASGTLVDAGADTRIADILAFVSTRLETETGRVFDAAAGSRTETIEAPGVSSVLILPGPARTITAITTGGTWNGATWTGDATLAIDDWRPWVTEPDGGILAIARVDGAWWAGQVRITGTWETDVGEDVPADVTYAVNFASAQQYKAENASAAGYVGGDGERIFVANPFTGVWESVVARYAVGTGTTTGAMVVV